MSCSCRPINEAWNHGSPPAASAFFRILLSYVEHSCVDQPVEVDRQWFKARVGFEPSETLIGLSLCRYALESTDLLLITDLTIDPRTR
jgi:hypothetical protein